MRIRLSLRWFVVVLLASLGALFAGADAIEFSSVARFNYAPDDRVYTGGVAPLPGGAGLAAVERYNPMSSRELRLIRHFTNGRAPEPHVVARSGIIGGLQEYTLATCGDGSVLLGGKVSGSVTLNPDEPDAHGISAGGLGSTKYYVIAWTPEFALAWYREVPFYVDSVAAFPLGRYAVSGMFRDTITVGAGQPNATTLVSAGDWDGVVAVYDASGEVQWAGQMAGPDTDAALVVSAFPTGDVAVSGRFGSALVFAAGTPQAATLTTTGSINPFVARYAAGGTLRWAERIPKSDTSPNQMVVLHDGGIAVCGRQPEFGSNAFLARYAGDGAYLGMLAAHGGPICVLPGGEILAIGTFSGTLQLGNPPVVLTASGAAAKYLAAYNPDLSLAWAVKDGDGSGLVGQGYGYVAASGESIYLEHLISGTCSFGLGVSPATVLTSTSSSSEVFVAGYRGLLLPHPGEGPLSFRYAKRAGGTRRDEGHGIAALPDGGAYVTGAFDFTVPATFGPGEPNETVLQYMWGAGMFLARYERNGQLRWARKAGQEGTVWGLDVARREDGGAVVAGYYQGTAVFGAGETTSATLSTTYSELGDGFLARYSADGSFLWARALHGTRSPADLADAVAVAPGGDILVAGPFGGSMVLGQGEPNQTTLPGDASDYFLARYASDGSLVWARRIETTPTSDFCTPRIVQLAVASDGAIYLAAAARDAVNFGAESFPIPPSRTALFIVAFNADGDYQWASVSDGAMYADGISADDSGLVVAGHYLWSATLAGRALTGMSLLDYSQMFVARFNQDGTLDWVATAGGDSGLRARA